MYKNFRYSLLLVCSFWFLGCGVKKSNSPTEVNHTEFKNTTGIRKSIVQKLKEYDHLPVEERIKIYKTLKKENPDDYNFENEDELTMYGYGFLWADKTEEAFAIFQLIVDVFGSPNSYDSLAEAYLKKGNKELALFYYEKALVMNPDNYNAEDQIALIRNPEMKLLTPTQKFEQVFTPEQYRADLDQLAQSILRIHPNALKFITKTAFWNNVEDIKSKINEKTTFAEFSFQCNKIIASVHCSHTGSGGFYPELEMLPAELFFPLQVRWLGEQLFVIDPMNHQNQIKPTDEILTINGVSVKQMIAKIFEHIPAQGYVQTTKTHIFNSFSSSYIPYVLGFPKSYSITIKGVENPVVLQKGVKKTGPFWYNLQYCRDQLCLKILEDQQTALMTITSFNYYSWNNLSEFVQFIDNSFQEIEKNNIKNLIIDVRFNGGGSQSAAIHLLRYLVEKPFIYYSKSEFAGKTEKSEGEEVILPVSKPFKGKTFYLIDGIGNSTTGHFMSLVKVLTPGIIIGEELGSNQFCSAGSTSCRLKHTKFTYYVANNTHISTATSLPDEKGILPDHFVGQNIQDVVNKKDVVLEYALKLLHK